MGDLVQFTHPASLEDVARNLVLQLRGQWSGRSGMCLCPAHDDRLPSLSVRVGHTSLLLKCFAGCETREVLRAIRNLQLDIAGRPSVRPMKRSHDEFVAERARELWHASTSIIGTPAEAYLAGRRIREAPAALRYHPRTPLGPRSRVVFRPALLAAIHSPIGLIAIQRIFLEPACANLARDIVPPRRLLGRPLDGAVRLAPSSNMLGLAEGIETALSAQATLRLPVWATLGAERLDQVAIPEGVRRLVLLPDRDRAGDRGAARACAAYAQAGRAVDILWPPDGFNDLNDYLKSRRK